MAGNLTSDREIRYIVDWFFEWSELQREDFIVHFVDYLRGAVSPKSNGIVHDNGSSDGGDEPKPPPMTLFQCRVKLFREWYVKWPEPTKERLLEKLSELDAAFRARVDEQMAIRENGHGHHAEDGDSEEGELVVVVEEPAPVVPNIVAARPDEIALNA